MNQEKQLEWIVALLRAESTLALATADADGLPYVAPLFYLVDSDLTLYWFSSARSQHSLNLLREPRAAATVYRAVHHWRDIRGVQMSGVTSMVDDPALRKRIASEYCDRFQLGTAFRLAIRQSTLYAFKPSFLRGIDNSHHFGEKFEITLESE
jgi:uncharacterized protein YhbP (UPF0306 family)